jgi:spermidine dehydrogenase
VTRKYDPDPVLGMDQPISRRDFLHDAALLTTMAAAPWFAAMPAAAQSSPLAAQDMPGYYPPLLNGLRGSHPGSFETAHALRDGNPGR